MFKLVKLTCLESNYGCGLNCHYWILLINVCIRVIAGAVVCQKTKGQNIDQLAGCHGEKVPM